MKLSYSLLYALLPFWALPPTTKVLQTCRCKQHENLQFVAEKLSVMRIIPTYLRIDEFAASISCDPSVNVYIYRKCEHCMDNTIEIAAPYDRDDLVKYIQWKTAFDENHCQKNQKSVLATNVRNHPTNHGMLLSPCIQHPLPIQRIQIERRQP